jgi:glycerol-3-phosphate acyltransferase PlsY
VARRAAAGESNGLLAHGDLPQWAVVALAYGIGAIPFANLAANALRSIDLRRVGRGKVGSSSLYEVTSFGPLAVVGCIEVLKGAVGPLAAGRHRPELGSLAGGLSLVGHNWSPLLRGGGGRGLAPALGATLALAPEGTALLGSGFGLGKLAHQTGLGSFLAMALLVPVLALTRGRRGLVTAGALVVPLFVKRLVAESPPVASSPGDRLRAYLCRLVFDRDPGERPVTPPSR